MSVGRVVYGALVGASVSAATSWARAAVICAVLALGCGERAGDPVVQVAPDSRQHNPATGPDGFGLAGPTGLCGACTSSDECGDANDACVQLPGEQFCGRDCGDLRDCPAGYSCLKLDLGQLWQCVPETHCPSAPAPMPPLDDVRQDLRTRINAARAARDRGPLAASSCLDALAQDSALAFARSDEPLGMFVNECDPLLPNCPCGWQAEAETSVAHYALDAPTALELALGSDAPRDPTDRFTRAYLDADMTEVGIGFWLSGDEAWIALSFR